MRYYPFPKNWEHKRLIPPKNKVASNLDKWLYPSHIAHLALMDWLKELPEEHEYLIVGIDCGRKISGSSLDSRQVNRVSKRITRDARVDDLVFDGISDHCAT